ncbi:hypothetical protein ACFLSQ_07770 [Bacteroidota bacterium]
MLSCSSSKDVISWNVEIKDSEIPLTDKCDPTVKLQSVKSPEKPKLLPATELREARVRVEGLPCKKGEKAPVYEIPMGRVKRITYVADPLQPPVQANKEDLAVIEGCCRVRDGWWIFDKLELRGFIGYRGSEDSVIYPTPTGYKTYESSFFGFDRGGSSLIAGFEAAGMWNVPFLDEDGLFQLGVMTGLWPMDEALFIPAGLYGRYTFNQAPSKYSEYCNTWYLYGTVGLPLDFETDAPIFGSSSDYQRYFYGLGIGYDWAINCDMDFSIDLGIRNMNLPLPPYTCCESTPEEHRNPFRSSTAVLLRFGLTF